MVEQQQQSMQFQRPLSPSEDIKKYIIQISKDCSELFALCFSSIENQFAFATKVRLFSIWLEPYTNLEIKQFNFKHYAELDERLQVIKASKDYNDTTKAQGIASTMFEYAIPICYQSIRVLQNSKILEQEVEGIIDLSKEPGPRIRGEEEALSVMTDVVEDDEDEPITG